MKKPPAIPTLLVLALAVALIVWAYGKRDVEVHASVSFDQDEVIIRPGGSPANTEEPLTYD